MTVVIQSIPATQDQPIILDGVSWDTYESLLSDLESSGQRKRVTYDRGRMLIVSPLPKHEKWKSLLGCFVEAIADERNIAISTFGATTWKRKDKLRGLEPDECFYIQHELEVRGKLDFDLRRDPPPDLAIEVDLRQDLIDKLGTYAALGVPEIWCHDGDTIRTLLLQQDGTYIASEFSAALSFLKPSDLKQFLDMFGQTDQGSLLRRVREWARGL